MIVSNENKYLKISLRGFKTFWIKITHGNASQNGYVSLKSWQDNIIRAESLSLYIILKYSFLQGLQV